MPYYTPKPELLLLECHQWFKNGDHPMDGVINNINEGAVVARHISFKNFTGDQRCPHCEQPMGQHGTMTQKETVDVICPGDYIETKRDAKKRIIGYARHAKKAFDKTYVKFVVKK